MFKPISDIYYGLTRKAESQFLACTFEPTYDHPTAAGTFRAPKHLDGLFQDLLANPHIRAIVLMQDGPARDEFVATWTGSAPILIQRFVALFDGEYHMRGILPPAPYGGTR